MLFQRTYSGQYVNVYNISPKDINIEDIAHSLSGQARFNYHTEGFISVADHSLRVANLAPAPFKLEALLDDASETYLGDLVSPVKHDPRMYAFRELEAEVKAVIFARFGVISTDESKAEVKRADQKSYDHERATFLLGYDLPEVNPMEIVEQTFLLKFNRYYNDKINNSNYVS